MPGSDEKVSVIIPTACEVVRAQSLKKSIKSVVDQVGMNVEIIVVVNGSRYDEELLTYLELDPNLKVVKIAEGNVSAARYAGIVHSSGDYFGFLDDDDEFLPGAISKRLSVLQEDESIDIVVTNGFECVCGLDGLMVTLGQLEINQGPAESFLKQNWFASPASLFRRKAVDVECFNIRHRYFEWSYLFFVLFSEGKVFFFDNSITYRYYKDTGNSASKSEDYERAYPLVLEDLCRLQLPPRVLYRLRNKYIIALNSLSNSYLRSGHGYMALKIHIKCLVSGGWRYLPYTMRVFWACVSRGFKCFC